MAGKEFSKQIGAANGGSPGLSNSVVRSPGDAVHGHLVDRLDPVEARAERDVLAEGHEMGLVVPVHLRAGGVELQHRGVLGPVGIIDHGTDDRGGSDRRHDPLHGRAHRGVGSGAGVE